MATKKMRAETFGSVDEFRAAVNLIAKQVLAIRKEELSRDKEVQKILDERNKTIEQMKTQAAGMLALCDAYAKDQRDEVFHKGTKTGETELCQYFLRLGAPGGMRVIILDDFYGQRFTNYLLEVDLEKDVQNR